MIVGPGGRRIIPRAPATPPAFTPTAKPPPQLGPERHEDAAYILDAGVGFAFAHVDRLELLAEHYSTQLCYTVRVFGEWEYRAETQHRPGLLGESAEEREERVRHNALRAAGARLVDRLPSLLGPPVELAATDSTAVEELRRELYDLAGEPVSGTGKHFGECESVQHGIRLLEGGREVVVLCANDGGARQLAFRHSIAQRTMHTALVEMEHEERVTAEERQSLFDRMCEVTELPARDRPARR